MSDLYDFSDWEPTEPPQQPAEWVRENLRAAFKAFGDGYWVVWSDSAPAFEWTGRDWDTDPVCIRFGPDDLKACLIWKLDNQVPDDGFFRSEEQREGVRSVMSIITKWRAALDAAEVQANEMLSRPISHCPPNPRRPT
jgi:hypothetical protein